MGEKKIVQKIVLGAVVVSGSKALILQRHENESVYPGMWELPSGKKDNLEPSMSALLREVKEEAGLDVEPVAPISVFDYQIEKPDEIRDSVQINFLARPKGSPTVALSSEHQAFAWITADELDGYPVTDATRGVIKKAFELAKLYAI